MRFNIFKEARISLLILSALISISLLFYFIASMFTSMGYKGLRVSNDIDGLSDSCKPIIVLDAGHGGEDPGAVCNGLIEKDLNLEIVKLVNDLLKANGYQTYLTREDDRLLYKSGEENRKKYFDIRNREKIANSFEDAVFISVHFNKFPAEYCNGFQAFYHGDNVLGKILAQSIQNSSRLIQPDNKRVAADSKTAIYLLEHLKMPSTLVECGFLSNEYEADLLKNSDYKVALAMSIYCGIVDYLENKK